MELSAELLAILRCPISKEPLRLATPDELARAEAQSGTRWDAGLATTDGARVYPIRDGFPILLREEAVDLTDTPPAGTP